MTKTVKVCALAMGTFGVAAALAIAAPSNGNFETGNFDDWEVFDANGTDRSIATGNWQVYKGKLKFAPFPRGEGPDLKLEAPPQGTYAAGMASEGPGTHILHRVIDVADDQKLNLQLAYWNSADDFYTPDSLSPNPPARGGGGGDFQNQQLRIDLMTPAAPLDSLEGSDIVKTIFRTKPGDDLKRAYGKISKKVPEGEYRLRIAEVDNQSNFLVGVDAVKLKDN